MSPQTSKFPHSLLSGVGSQASSKKGASGKGRSLSDNKSDRRHRGATQPREAYLQIKH